MKNKKWMNHVRILCLSAFVYGLLDWPVQATGFLTFGPGIGIKNFLPVTLGLFFGPSGVIGCCIGGGLVASILATPGKELLLEWCCILILGIGSWILWHLGSTTHRIHFKRPINYLKYFGILVLLSSLCGLLSFLFVEGGSFLTILAAYTSLGLLVGIPVNILFNGLFCLEPVLPPFYQVEYALTGQINADTESLIQFNEQLEEIAFTREIGLDRVFEIQNCIEEISIRIIEVMPEVEMQICMNFGDTISARISYEGDRYNPLLNGKEDDEFDLMGLKLIKHRALRALYQYRNGENQIHVVV